MAQIANANFSKRVRRMLGLGLDTWNSITVASLWFAAFAAVVVGVSNYAVIKLQKQEAQDAAAAFEQYKLETGEKIAVANERAEAERLARIKIEARIAWRELSPSQSRSITSALSNTPLRIVLWHLSTDPEATNLYIQLKDAFISAGVQIEADDDRALINSGIPRYGVLLGGRETDVARMRTALEGAGIVVTTADIRDDTLNVWIGTKPLSK